MLRELGWLPGDDERISPADAVLWQTDSLLSHPPGGTCRRALCHRGIAALTEA